MNDDCRRIFEMLAAINTRLEMNERSTRQIDQQLALLNLKREAELAEFHDALKTLTAAVDELKNIRAAISDNAAVASSIDALRTELAVAADSSAFARAVDDLKAEVAAAKTADDLAEIRAAIGELKNSLKNSGKADELLTIRMALQNTSVAINEIKKRVDGIKFDTNKKFNELNLNSEINHKALTAAVSEIKGELLKLTAEIKPAETAPDFEVSTWWSGNKER